MAQYKFVGGPTPCVTHRPVISEQIKRRVEEKVDQCLAIAKHRYQINRPCPTIDYTLSGLTAGLAFHKQWKIKINSVLLLENTDNVINDTVPHEVAHLVAREMYGRGIKPHGKCWCGVMDLFGVEPRRCHRYNTTNSRVRHVRKWTYVCACDTEYKFAAKRHRKQQVNPKTYYCRRCRAYLLLKGE